MVERRVRPSALHPLWNVAGFALGAATALLGPKAAMACTVAVEEVIDEHYRAQSDSSARTKRRSRPRSTSSAPRNCEHRDTGLEHGAEQAPAYPLLTGAIKAGSTAGDLAGGAGLRLPIARLKISPSPLAERARGQAHYRSLRLRQPSRAEGGRGYSAWMNIRPVTKADADAWLAMRRALWPDADAEELRAEVAAFFAGEAKAHLPHLRVRG